MQMKISELIIDIIVDAAAVVMVGFLFHLGWSLI